LVHADFLATGGCTAPAIGGTTAADAPSSGGAIPSLPFAACFLGQGLQVVRGVWEWTRRTYANIKQHAQDVNKRLNFVQQINTLQFEGTT
jgi:hypothetical protein